MQRLTKYQREHPNVEREGITYVGLSKARVERFLEKYPEFAGRDIPWKTGKHLISYVYFRQVRFTWREEEDLNESTSVMQVA